MSSTEFAELCDGAAEMLAALAGQARDPSKSATMVFDIAHAPEAISTLGKIIVAISESSK